MRIVHLVPAMEEGGVERVVLNLSHVLTRAGDEAIVISRGGKLAFTLEANGARHIALDLKSKNPLTYLSRALGLRRVLKALAPDLVCVHSRVPAWLFVLANRALKLPWISYAHGANSVSRYSEVMTKGDAVVAPSRFLADYLKTNYVSCPEVTIIPNGVDLERFDPTKLDMAFIAEKRREWGIAEGERVIMSIGRITKLKGFDAVIRDFAVDPRGKLIIVGGADVDKAELFEELKKLVVELGLGEKVIFAGAQTKIPECLSLATEVISGNITKPESFGLSVIEAYAMNVPVRCLRDFGGTAEVIRQVAAEGAPSLREAVRRLYGLDTFAAATRELYRRTVDHVRKLR